MKDEIKEILECLEKYGQLTPDAIDDLHYIRDHITNLQEEVKSANESITWWNNRFNAVQEENEELKMTNLALADDITKNKIIKQEVLTECCGIPIGEIPMLKIQNDEYKSRIDKAIEYMNNYNELVVPDANIKSLILKEEYKKIINLLQGKSDE